MLQVEQEKHKKESSRVREAIQKVIESMCKEDAA